MRLSNPLFITLAISIFFASKAFSEENTKSKNEDELRVEIEESHEENERLKKQIKELLKKIQQQQKLIEEQATQIEQPVE